MEKGRIEFNDPQFRGTPPLYRTASVLELTDSEKVQRMIDLADCLPLEKLEWLIERFTQTCADLRQLKEAAKPVD